MHQQSSGRRVRTAAEGGAGAAWPCDNRPSMDRYGHLFPSGDDGSEMEAAERALFG